MVRLFNGVIAGLLIYSVTLAVFAPWSFFLGGSFHPIPDWQGWGDIQTSSGNFKLYVLLSQPRIFHGFPYITGYAELCTPAGEKFTFMQASAYYQNKYFGSNSNNQPIKLSIINYGLLGQFKTDHRPAFDLYGIWQNPKLVLEDHGSLGSAFLPNGQAYLGPGNDQPPPGKNLAITLVPGSRAQFEAVCQTSH